MTDDGPDLDGLDGLDGLEIDVALIHAVQRLGVASQRLGQVFAAREGLHPTDLEALLHVMQAQQEQAPLTAGQLADRLHLTGGAVTGVVDRLERRGHLDRERDPTDRRRVIVRASSTAHTVAEGFFSPLGDLGRDIAATFSPDEQRAVLRYLHTITEAIDRHAAAADDGPHA